MIYKIRLAEEGDIPFLKDVEQSAAIAFHVLPDYHDSGRTVPAKILLEMTASRKLWIAVTDTEQPVGFIGCRNMGRLLYIHEVSVAHDFQKQGIGRSLVLTVIECASHSGYQAVGLTTRRDAAWNFPFYKSLDFLEINDGSEWPDLFMQLQQEILNGADPVVRCAMIRKL